MYSCFFSQFSTCYCASSTALRMQQHRVLGSTAPPYTRCEITNRSASCLVCLIRPPVLLPSNRWAISGLFRGYCRTALFGLCKYVINVAICCDLTSSQIESRNFQIESQIESRCLKSNLYSSNRITKTVKIAIY